MLSPDEYKHVAELHYLEKKSRPEILAELSKRLKNPPTDNTMVNHWLEELRVLGVVAFDFDSSFAVVGDFNKDLSGRLTKEFALDQALVMDVSKHAQSDIKADELHTALANESGKCLSGNEEFQGPLTPNSSILCAGGRTVLQVVRKIARSRLSSHGIRVDPLSGRNWTGSWQVVGEEDLERPLDADDAARTLASALAFPKSGTRFSQIGSPLYAETSRQAERIMRDQCAFLPGGKWNWDIPGRSPRIAICGVGSLKFGSGHRIMQFLEAYLHEHGVASGADIDRLIQENGLADIQLPDKPAKSAPYLSTVAVDLLDAIKFAAQRRLGYFGDVANRLYPCLPLPSGLSASGPPRPDDYASLLAKLDVLNGRAIVAQWSHLRDTSTWITAGGRLKFPAIWTLAIARYLERQPSSGVGGRKSIMDRLTTDSVTAQNLLDELEEFKKAPSLVRDWYAQLAGMLFASGKSAV